MFVLGGGGDGEETVAETVEETVEETVAETVAETVEETVVETVEETVERADRGEARTAVKYLRTKCRYDLLPKQGCPVDSGYTRKRWGQGRKDWVHKIQRKRESLYILPYLRQSLQYSCLR